MKKGRKTGASATKVLLAYISRAAYAAQSISENLSRRIASDCIAADPYGLRGPYGHGLPRKWDRGYTHTMGEIQKESTGGKERERERRRIYGGESDPTRVIIGQIAMRMDEL